MDHLVITVSVDSSLELLGKYADVIVLDKDSLPIRIKSYKSVYIRSHFSIPELLPQKFCTEIETLVGLLSAENPAIIFIDNMASVDVIVAFEDKWHQYKKFSEFMPSTRLFSDSEDTSEFTRPIYKKRLSSRSTGVTWNSNEVVGAPEDWIVKNRYLGDFSYSL